MVINFITKCFSKVNSELCFSTVEVFSPYPCTCQEAWQAVWFSAIRFFKSSQVRVGWWQGSGPSLPTGASSVQEQTSADGPLELHIPQICAKPLPGAQQAWAARELAAPGERCWKSSSAELWSVLAEAAQQCWCCWRCWWHRDDSAGAVSWAGQCQKGLGCTPAQRRICIISTKTHIKLCYIFILTISALDS